MHIRLQTDGGFGYFPGLDEPVVVDTADLPADETARLEGLVRNADFFDRKEHADAPAPGAADLRRYTVTVEDAGRTHTVEASDPLEDPALHALIDALTHLRRTAADR